MPIPNSGSRFHCILVNVPIQASKQPDLKVLAALGNASGVWLHCRHGPNEPCKSEVLVATPPDRLHFVLHFCVEAGRWQQAAQHWLECRMIMFVVSCVPNAR